MKRKLSFAAVALAMTVLLSSCIGSFGLTNKVKDWNESVTDSKFVNELLFIAMHIVPVYEVTMFVDGVVLNSVEFWTGNSLVDAENADEVVAVEETEVSMR